MLKLEHKSIHTEFSLETKECLGESSTSRIGVGLTSTWSMDLGGDIFYKGCFKESIQKRFKDSIRERGYGRIRFMYQHKEVIGTVRSIEETDEGLKVGFYFSKISRGNEVLTLVEDKALDQMSIGYIAQDFSYDGIGPWNEGKGRRHIYKADIQESSIVIFPMNEETEVFEVHSRELEEFKEVTEVKEEIPVIVIEEPALEVELKSEELTEATVLDFEFKELAHRVGQINLEIKKGAKLNASYTKSLISVLGLVHEVLSSAMPKADAPEATLEACGNDCPDESADPTDSLDPNMYKGVDGAVAVREVMSKYLIGTKAMVQDPTENLVARKNPANTQTSPADPSGSEDYTPNSTFDGPGLEANGPNAEGTFDTEGDAEDNPLPTYEEYQGFLDKISEMLASLK